MMVSARTIQVRARVAALRGLLGSKCCDCGNRYDLEFDCIKPQGDEHHKAGSMKRIQFYELQNERGNLALRCKFCHRVKTNRDNRRAKAIWHYDI